MRQEKFIQIAMNKASTVYTARSGNEQQFKHDFYIKIFQVENLLWFESYKVRKFEHAKRFILEVSEMN